MKLKENLKHQIDQLNTKDLRIIKLMLDSLPKEENDIKKSSNIRNKSFQKVINVLGKNKLTTREIHQLREDRV
ncbi:MAG: hypothetical protein WD038_02955 [Balneolales bacterium]